MPVNFKVFNDGSSGLTGASGAAFINYAGQACIPDGTSSGTCRKWFGLWAAPNG
jgi:hypothetical protein